MLQISNRILKEAKTNCYERKGTRKQVRFIFISNISPCTVSEQQQTQKMQLDVDIEPTLGFAHMMWTDK